MTMNGFELLKLKRMAKKGNSEAARLVGYELLNSEKKDLKNAKEFLFLALKGGENVRYDLATLMLSFVETDQRAKEILYSAIELDHADAIVSYARHFGETNEEKSSLYLKATRLFSKEGARSFISLHLEHEELDHSEVLYWAEKYALQGDVDFITLLGKCYEDGIGTNKSEEDATYWYLKGADLGSDECFYRLAKAYEYGSGVKTNQEKAVSYYEKVKDIYPFDYGRILLQRGDERGVEYLKKVADTNEEASFLLAKHYENKDEKLAILYFSKALSYPYAKFRYAKYKKDDKLLEECIAERYAEALVYVGERDKNVSCLEEAIALGNNEAKLPLAKLYYQKEEYKKAFALFNDIECAEAYYYTGLFYQKGFGVKQSYRKSALAYEYAAEKGNVLGITAYGKCLDTGFGVKINHEEAVKQFVEAERLGDMDAVYELGMHYLKGVGVEKNLELSARKFYLAAQSGHKEASYQYAKCLQDGLGVKKNDKKSFAYLIASAKNGYGIAQYTYAGCLFQKKKTQTEALRWYEKAFENGEKDALWMIATCYRLGLGTSVSADRAQKLYEMGIEFFFAQQLFEVYGYFKDGTLPKDEKMMNHFLLCAAQKGHAEAQYLIGVSYRDGSRGFVNLNDALFWFRKAVEGGYAEATYDLANCYESGVCVDLVPQKAFELYLSLAEKGYVQANYPLANCYMNGFGVEKNEETAFEYYQRSASVGKMEAQAKLAKCYETGLGTEIDETKAGYYYELAARQGDALSAYRAYVCNSENKLDMLKQAVSASIPEALCAYGKLVSGEEAFAYFKRSAQSDVPEACYLLAECYLTGNGTKQILEEGVVWLKKATKLGYGVAEMRLAECYRNGVGIAMNLKRSAFHYEMQADQGIARAQLITGDNYRFGVGVKVNYRRAYEWYLASAIQGNAEAQYKVGLCLYDGMGCSVSREDSFRWLKKAFEGLYHSVEAKEIIEQLLLDEKPVKTIYLGDLFFEGKGVEQNFEKAAYWYRRSAEFNSSFAYYKLGRMYLLGQGVMQDDQEAFYCFEQGAKLGHIDAMYETAVSYLDGRGVIENREKAFEWFDAFNEANQKRLKKKYDKKYELSTSLQEKLKLAVKEDNVESYYIIASRFRSSFGVPSNSERAVYWYRKASDKGYAKASYYLATYLEKGDGVQKNENEANILLRFAADKGILKAKARFKTEEQPQQEEAV